MWAYICFAINFLYAVYLAGLGVLLEPVGRTFALGSAAQARLFPASFTGMIVSVLLSGYLSDRFGRRRVLLTSACVYSLALCLFAKAHVFGLVLAAAALIGAGSGAMQTVANALVAGVFVDRQKVMVNAAQIAFGAGAICGPVAASRALAAGVDWRTLFLVLATAMVVLICVAAVAPATPIATPVSANAGSPLRSIVTGRGFLNLCLVAALYAGAEVGFFQWLPSYFDQRIQDGHRWAGSIVSVFWVGMTSGRVAGGSLIVRYPLVPLRSALAALGGLFSLAALAFPTPWPTIASVFLTGLCFGAIFSLVLAEAAERYPHSMGSVFGGVVAISGVGTAVVPWAIGTLASTPLDWRGALCLVPLCAFAVAANGLVAMAIKR